ncbi:MAG: hypothetical protein INR69_02895 [Mucilaginibacter polytrichastri]|nr:hypothetical protein [Mucilaginibacter polytrichastri]
MNPKKITVIGSTNMDMVVKAAHLPTPGETVLGGSFLMNPGGKGANQAVAVARLGGDTLFVTKIGNDLFGKQSSQLFDNEGIDTSSYRKNTTDKPKAGLKGIVISIVAGVLMSFFYRFVASSMDLENFVQPAVGKMTPYTASVLFSLGILCNNFLFNTVMMRKPVEGSPVSYSEYFKGGFSLHIIGVLGGAIWALGNLFNLIAAGKAGPAISCGLGQGATLIAAIWGVAVWKEFKGVTPGVHRLISAMFVFFVAGIALIILAGGS